MKPKAKPLVFKIYGMDCAEEVATLKHALGPLVVGEEQMAFDILHAKLLVEASVSISSEEVIQAVARTGMRAEILNAQNGQKIPLWLKLSAWSVKPNRAGHLRKNGSRNLRGFIRLSRRAKAGNAGNPQATRSNATSRPHRGRGWQ